mgnify:CR=1 FL=1
MIRKATRKGRFSLSLCGYVPEQKLICKNLLEKLQENVQKAQRSREQKLSGEHLK